MSYTRIHYGSVTTAAPSKAQGPAWRAAELSNAQVTRDLIASLGWAFAMAAVFFRWSGLELEQGAPAIGVMAGVILLAAWRLERRVQRLVVQVATDRLVA